MNGFVIGTLPAGREPEMSEMARSSSGSVSEFSREEIAKELQHDYSTGRTGVVPAGVRRSLYHFMALWITLAAGFTYLFLGFCTTMPGIRWGGPSPPALSARCAIWCMRCPRRTSVRAPVRRMRC